MTIPAVERLKKDRGGEIWWICGEMVAPILARYNFIDKIIPVNEKKLFRGTLWTRLSELFRIWGLIAGVTFDTYAVLKYDPRYRLIGLPVRSRRRVILKKEDRMNDVIRGRAKTDEFTRLLLGLDGPITQRIQPLPLPGLQARSQQTRRVGIVPGGAKNLLNDSPLRRWPLDNYLALTKLLIKNGFDVFLMGAQSDRWTLPTFERLPVVDRMGSLSLVESIELIASLNVCVTHDTGVLHMAGLTQTPIVALFGPTSPREFLPNREDIICHWGGENLACRPCYDGRALPEECAGHFCMREITPDMVFSSVMSLTEERPGSLISIENSPPMTACNQSTAQHR